MDTNDDTQDSPLAVLGQSLAALAACYQRLLDEKAAPEYCREAGRTLRFLAHRYSELLGGLYGVNGAGETEDAEDENDENDSNLLAELGLNSDSEVSEDNGDE
jgi:hypothetical protein